MVTKMLTKTQAHEMVKPTNRPVMDAGYEITVKPGVTIRKQKFGAVTRYVLTER